MPPGAFGARARGREQTGEGASPEQLPAGHGEGHQQCCDVPRWSGLVPQSLLEQTALTRGAARPQDQHERL